jgi:hypothetical protein
VEKRYPYKIPLPAVFGLLAILVIFVTGSCLLLPKVNNLTITPGIALTVGILVAGFVLVTVLLLRILRPSYLIIRQDGISLPGRPKEGWWVAFSDIKEVRIDPPFLGYRSLAMEAQPKPWSKTDERWWSINERMLPSKEAFDEICSFILSHVESAPPEQKLDCRVE